LRVGDLPADLNAWLTLPLKLNGKSNIVFQRFR
jgi:hypothetical protein